MLAAISVLPLALAAALRVAAPAALPLLPASVDAEAATRVASAVLLLLTPMMFGFVIGLMLLDERDEGVLTAVSLTPVGKAGFVAYRMAVPMLWSVLISLVVVPLAGLVRVAPSRLAAFAVLAGLQAPMLALFLGAFAADKVQGMALAKVGSLLIGVGALVVIAPAPWYWLGAVSPHFWLVRLFLDAGATTGAFTLQLAAALGVHLLVLWGLLRIFRRRAG